MLAFSNLRCIAALAILGALAACSTTTLLPPEPPASTVPPLAAKPEGPPRATLLRERSRWVAAEWRELPGWGEDRAAELWPALLRGCERPASGWAELCARAALQAPEDDAQATLWLMQHLQPWRVESLTGETQGLMTGYFEPELQARRQPEGSFQIPLLAAPPDLAQRRPYLSRKEIDSSAPGRFKPLVFIEDPVDLQILQLQGSGRVRMSDGTWLRMAFNGHNDLPLQALGRALAAMGEYPEGPAAPRPYVREWAKRNPQRLNELLWANPRYVFFREEPLPDPNVGPKGAQGVPLTPGRSVAVDRLSVPYGTPMWLDAEPSTTNTALRRLVMAQDTGGNIVGAVRVDFFWGWGSEAEAQASRTRQNLRVWALWPR